MSKLPDVNDARHNPPKGGGPVWMVVSYASGMAEASIIAGRLQSLGVPAFVHRESVGAALGLSIGLGQATVLVPEAYYEIALAILEPDESIPWLGDGEEDEENEESYDERDID